MLVSIKGAGFTDQTIDWSNLDFSNGLLPTALNGVQVFINGHPLVSPMRVPGSFVPPILPTREAEILDVSAQTTIASMLPLLWESASTPLFCFRTGSF